MCGQGNIMGDIFSGVSNAMNSVQSRAEAKGNAKTVNSMARVEAQKMREQAKKNASSARAAAAENGLDVDVGAAAMIQDEHIADGEYNANITISDAANNARNIRRTGKMISNSYGLKAASNVVSGVATAKGWK